MLVFTYDVCACSWLVQFAVLWKRSFMYQLRNPAIAATRLFFSNIGGIIAGRECAITSIFLKL